jgi:hypothetical protein
VFYNTYGQESPSTKPVGLEQPAGPYSHADVCLNLKGACLLFNCGGISVENTLRPRSRTGRSASWQQDDGLILDCSARTLEAPEGTWVRLGHRRALAVVDAGRATVRS